MISESEERRRVFKFYKSITDCPAKLDEVDRSLDELVSKTTLQNSSSEFLKRSFAVQYNYEEEFYIFRSAISDAAVNSFYEDILFDWPINTEARSNILEEVTPKLWAMSFQEMSPNTRGLLDRLRWITLGYHYDWDNRMYPSGCEQPFPTKCGEFFLSVATKMLDIIGDNKSLLTGRDYFLNFVPEASIVNCYRKKTNMGFHVDDCELAKKAPLISISLGRPAIFLLEASNYFPGNLPHGHSEFGNKTIIPIILRHGDIIVTGGHSRLAYHAVPRLLLWEQPSNDLPISFLPNLVERFRNRFGLECNRKILEDYVCSTRLNVNVRQVV
ncbi:unnamed protein product [Rodentolepis nana]|uniref:2OG-FeII_Oxy_2 domain-containing protein n=1 Tax=Rodentolepis nana TaxID=102285 RepID=A0A0R3TVR2_RODNA|nr:unnamed protein product [Rodentolepis nana]